MKPLIAIKSWRFKPDYIRSKHLGPVTLPAERKKAEKNYALMAVATEQKARANG